MFVIFVLYFCVYVAAVILKILSPPNLCVCVCVCLSLNADVMLCPLLHPLPASVTNKAPLSQHAMQSPFFLFFFCPFFPSFFEKTPQRLRTSHWKGKSNTHTHTHTQGSGGCLVTLVPRGCLPSNLSQMWRIENHVWPSEILLPSWTRPPRPTAGRSLLPGPAEPCPLGQTATDLCQLQTHTNAV